MRGMSPSFPHTSPTTNKGTFARPPAHSLRPTICITRWADVYIILQMRILQYFRPGRSSSAAGDQWPVISGQKDFGGGQYAPTAGHLPRSRGTPADAFVTGITGDLAVVPPGCHA